MAYMDSNSRSSFEEKYRRRGGWERGRERGGREMEEWDKRAEGGGREGGRGAVTMLTTSHHAFY